MISGSAGASPGLENLGGPTANAERIRPVARAAAVELAGAMEKFGPMAGPHEGYAVILEELDELWEEVKGDQDPTRMREEAVQIAAMAMRFVLDVSPGVERVSAEQRHGLSERLNDLLDNPEFGHRLGMMSREVHALLREVAAALPADQQVGGLREAARSVLESAYPVDTVDESLVENVELEKLEAALSDSVPVERGEGGQG